MTDLRKPDLTSVPVIDATLLARGDRSALAALDQACRQWGFLQLVNHSMDLELIGSQQQQMCNFFAQSTAAKRAIERSQDNTWGYYDRELTKNRQDWKEIFDVGPNEGTNCAQWPASLPGFAETLTQFTEACTNIATMVLHAISTNLGMPAEHLDADFANHTSFLRLNCYPPCPAPASADAPTVPESGHLGIHHHTDAGAITVLLQDEVAGLQVLHNNRWHIVAPLAGALTINIGDVVQVWSNDVYPAALHRVLANTRKARYSAAFFFNPGSGASYAPLAGVLSEAHPARYRSINWGEFRRLRAQGDYADYGSEVQISDYRSETIAADDNSLATP